MLGRIRTALAHRLLPLPVDAQLALHSAIFSAADDNASASPDLVSFSLEAVRQAQQLDLARLGPATADPSVGLWPGEHYKLLAGLVLARRPRLVIEVGTATGLSALCMKACLPAGGRLVTFDTVAWRAFGSPNGAGWQACASYLGSDDFADGRLVQEVADLSDPASFTSYRPLIEQAELVFIDAAHDGVMERRLVANLQTVSFSSKVVLVFDDIRLWSMLSVWREIARPKLDLTSFGHWSGTGIVEWN
jgi:hypothetical protein